MKFSLSAGERKIDLSSPVCMGIINVTPDSFSDGSELASKSSQFSIDLDRVLFKAESLIAEGATIIDVGGESTRPGASPVSDEEELQRVIPAIEVIKNNLDVCISVDTSSPIVMSEAISAGVGLINDVRAFSKLGALEVAIKSNAALCLTHMQGQPMNMQESFQYTDLLTDVFNFLKDRIKAFSKTGVLESRLVIDPGFGFGKSLEHNYQILKHLSVFEGLNLPILVGISRKSMIGDVVGHPVKERVYGSVAATVLALNNGASIIRTHDVAATMDAIRVHSIYQRV